MKLLFTLPAALLLLPSCSRTCYMTQNAKSFYGSSKASIVSTFGMPTRVLDVDKKTTIYEYYKSYTSSKSTDNYSTTTTIQRDPWVPGAYRATTTSNTDPIMDGLTKAFVDYDCTILFTFSKDVVTDVQFSGNCVNYKPTH